MLVTLFDWFYCIDFVAAFPVVYGVYIWIFFFVKLLVKNCFFAFRFASSGFG